MSFEFLIALAVKSTLVAMAALAASWLLRRRPAREQVAALGAGILALFALPWASLLLPSLDIAVVAEAALPPSWPLLTEFAGASALEPVPLLPEGPSAPEFILFAYLCGILFFATRLAFGLVLLAGWTRRSRPVTDARWLAARDRACDPARRRPRLLASPEIASPLSWGVWPGTILIDVKTLRTPERADAVIAHELAHIHGLDWPALLLARAATVLFWFNPFVWLLERALSCRAEIAADEAAARRVERFAYAQMLLDVANEAQVSAPACGMAAAPSLLAERLRCILAARRPRPAGKLAPVAILGGALVVSTPLAATRFVTVVPLADIAPIAARQQGQHVMATRPSTARPGDAKQRSHVERQERRLVPATNGASTALPAAAMVSSQVTPPAAPTAAPPRWNPTMEQRKTAWQMAERARMLRNRAAALNAQSNAPRAGPGRDPPEAIRALQAEADQLDMAARQLLSGS